MKSHIKRTKIIATLGPAITGYVFTKKDFEDKKNKSVIDQAKQNIENLIDAGVNVFRFNFSHGDYEEQTIRINLIREVEAKTGKSVSLMLDTKGPEIRIGKFKDKSAEVKAGSTVTLISNVMIEGTGSKFSVYSSAPGYYIERDLKLADPIYVDDGKLQLVVKKIDEAKHEITCEALNTHTLIANKRINLPNAEYTMPFVSEKDENDIKFAVENDFDYIACSFVNTVDNVSEVRALINKYGKDSKIQIVSKIETQQAINNIDDIISVSDGIMVARGDLGLEIPYYEVPFWEKYMIKACRYQGKPVIVATQMLDSLEKNMQPTRAEVTDVFYAVERGADATMLSGESANGIDPVNAVKVMATIDKKAEEFFDYSRAHEIYFKQTFFSKKQFGKTVEKIAKQVEPRRTIGNSEFPYDAIIYFGSDIEKIKALSNVRPAANIFVVTDKKRLQKYFGLNYGVSVLIVDNLINTLSSYKDKVNQIHDDFELQRASIVLIDDQYKKTEF